MKQRNIILMLILYFSVLYYHSFANQIVYPWRACPAIVPVGEKIDILYDNINFMLIDSIILEGPFNRVILPIDTIMSGWFVYDTYTKMGISSIIQATIPSETPEELYDLIVKSRGETNLSKKSVKVLKKYRNPHRFIHISDPHISRQWIGTDKNGYAKELELLDKFIEVANIIHPEYIIVTGDIIHDYTRFNADSTGWGGIVRSGFNNPPLAEEKYKNYFEGANGFSGVYGFNAPVFSVAGNHDFYGYDKSEHMAISAQWNRLMGKRVYGFSYKDTRILAVDDYLGDPVVDIPDQTPMSGLQGLVLDSFLNTTGQGKIRIMAQHRWNRIDTTFINRNRINILLNGHNHSPHQEYVGNIPTLSIRSGVVCRSGEISRWEKTLGFFRIFTIDDDTFQFSPPLRFCKNPTDPYEQLVLNLTLTFKNDNNGLSKSNEAVLTNHFDIDLPDCQIRFIMPKNKSNYKVSNAEIFQIIENYHFTVVDARTDLQAKSSKIVKID